MNKIILQAKAFYIKDFLTVKEIYRKTFTVSVILILFENIQMLSLSTYQINNFEYDQFLLHIRSVIDFFRFYPIIGNSLEIKFGFTFLGFVLQTFIILLFLYLIQKMSMQVQKKQQMQNLVLEQSVESHIQKDHVIKLLLSIYYQFYPGLLQYPFIFCSVSLLTDIFQSQNHDLLNYFGLIIGILMLAQQLLIGLFINLHQFEYRMKSFDFLGKHQTQRVYLIYGLQLLITLLSGIKINNIAVQICGVLLSLINIVSCYYQLIFVDFRISRLHFQINVLQLLYQLILLLCEYGQPKLKISIVILLVFFYPFIFSLSNQLLVRQDMKSIGFGYLDMQKRIRRLYQIFKEQVQLKKQQRLLDPIQALQIYTFITAHLRECKLVRERKMQRNIKLKYKCFCNDFFKDDDTFSTLQQMKSFATELIGQTLEDEIVENPNIDLILIYIYYLVQIKKVPTQAIYEVIRLSIVSKGLPLKNIAIIHKLKHDALSKFDDLVRKNDLVNQKFVFKKVYQYEESLNIFKNNLCIVVKQEKDFYASILTQIIDIDVLLEIGFKLIENIKILEQQIQLLYKTNPQSNECDTIFNIFYKYVNYNKLRPKLYRREGQLMTQFIQSAEKIIFDPGSCVIQITLLQPRGNVIRYTRSFQKAIGYTDEEIQDQNINRFMPQIIANDHDLYLDNFVERGRINVVRYAVRVILGKTKSQFVVPINTRLRIETSPTEFGATALITPVNLTYGYMMLNEQGQIEELTKNMYDDVFQKHMGLELDYVKGLDCLFFIPELAKQWHEFFDEHFEKLDRRFDCQLILPSVNKMTSQNIMMGSRSNLMTKSQMQQQILKGFQNCPHENVVYQITLHVVSLITINLRLVILEIPEYKQLSNQKVTSKQMIQLRNRSSQLLITNDQDTTPYQAELLTSVINSPPGGMNEYDLEYANLIEEIKMVEDLRYQLGIVNNTNPVQNTNAPYLMQSSQNLIEERVVPQLDLNLNSMKSNSQSESDSEQLQKQMDQNYQYNGSVGSRSSQNNTTALKRQIKDCLTDNRGLSVKTKLFLLLFYVLVLVGYAINYTILYVGFKQINQNQKYENLPFQFSYFYNEFVITQSIQSDSVDKFKLTNSVCKQFYNDMLKDIDSTITLLPQINIINNLTLQQRMLNILSQMTITSLMNSEISVIDFFNNSDAFETQKLNINVDSSSDIVDLSIYVISEEIVLVFLISWYIYICILIIKMKTKIYKLFCTFSKEAIQEQFLQFSSMWNQLNNSKFKNHETDEEQFETTMMRQYQKTVSSNMLYKHGKVGKRISSKRTLIMILLGTNSVQVLFFLFLGLYAFICSFYFIGSYILQKLTVTTVFARYNEKIQFEIAQNQLAFSFATMAILMNQTITNDYLNRYNNTVKTLAGLRTTLSLYQQSYNSEVYSIMIENVCNVLSNGLNTSYNLYDQLFTLDVCQQISGLEKGLSSVFQELYSSQFDYLQSLTVGKNTALSDMVTEYTQLERLHAQYGLQVIVTILTEQIISLTDSTFVINTIMLAFATIIMTAALLITKLTIEKVKEQYKLCKQLLSLFPFDRLMENAYVISFITLDLQFSV